MNSVSLICPDASPEVILASAHRPHLVRFHRVRGNGEAVIASASLAAAIQIASERLAAAGVSVAEVLRDDQSGDISMLTSEGVLVVAITASEGVRPERVDSVLRIPSSALMESRKVYAIEGGRAVVRENGAVPATIALRCASVSWRCVVEAGCRIRLLASPMLARWEKSRRLSIKVRPASRPPLMPKPRMPL